MAKKDWGDYSWDCFFKVRLNIKTFYKAMVQGVEVAMGSLILSNPHTPPSHFQINIYQVVNVIQHAWHPPIIPHVFGTLHGVSLVLFDDTLSFLNAILAFNHRLNCFANSCDIIMSSSLCLTILPLFLLSPKSALVVSRDWTTHLQTKKKSHQT